MKSLFGQAVTTQTGNTTLRNILFCLLLGITIFLTLNKHNKAPYGDYNSQIFSDAAGYYVHLPATFIYGYGKDYPVEFIEKCEALGVQVIKPKNQEQKLVTKYPLGVAIMEAPFFLIAHCYAILFNLEANGYSAIYQASISIAASFYGVLAIFILFSFFKGSHSTTSILATLLIVFFGTNYYYYVVDSPGMSHVFSFFLISSFLLLFKRINAGDHSLRLLILLFITGALVVLVRTVNGIVLILPLVLWVNSKQEAITRIKYWITLKNILIFLGIFLLVFIPQFSYNYFISESLSLDAYDNEHFVYLTSPQFLKVWFAPLNGLFLYNPLYFLFFLGAIYLIREKIWNGWVILGFFLTISYVYASWWSTELGCGYGHRGFVEWLPVYSIGLILSLIHI